LIGDTARLKAGIKGFLVHVATNSLLYIGATAILLTVNLYLGLLLVIAGLAIAAITVRGASVVFHLALEHRNREGKMALSLERKLAGHKDMMRSFKKHNARSGSLEAAVTKTIGRTTWAAHAIYGAAVVTALGTGAAAISVDQLAVSDFTMFLLYALILRAPIVQLTRQGTRTGKMLACAVRLDEIITAASSSRSVKRKHAADSPQQNQLNRASQKPHSYRRRFWRRQDNVAESSGRRYKSCQRKNYLG
jgi:ABC-type multidrug transport system fused ATPase/permease subunit